MSNFLYDGLKKIGAVPPEKVPQNYIDNCVKYKLCTKEDARKWVSLLSKVASQTDEKGFGAYINDSKNGHAAIKLTKEEMNLLSAGWPRSWKEFKEKGPLANMGGGTCW